MDGAGPTLAPGTCLESWDGGNRFEGTLWEQDETTRVRHRELACCTANTQTLSSDRARLGTSQKRPPRKVFFFLRLVYVPLEMHRFALTSIRVGGFSSLPSLLMSELATA